MSGHSDNDTCPNCGELMAVYTDYKPFPLSTCDCEYCGFYSEVKIGLRSKQDLIVQNAYEGLSDEEIEQEGLYKNALDGNTAEFKKKQKKIEDWNFSK